MRDVPPARAGRAPFRLPDTVKPRHYDIEIEPNLACSTFDGRVAVELDIVKSTKVIVFHALNCNITHASVIRPGTTNPAHAGVHYEPENEVSFVVLEDKLPAGSTATLIMKYIGEMTAAGSMGGLFPSSYTTHSGELKLGFETMMEPTMARAVFPCFDEPDFKARFKISLLVDRDLTCLSNMEIASETQTTSHSARPKKRVVFDTTPIMSTYLVVIIAGYFNVLETKDFHVPIRIWAALDRDIKDTAYALEIAVKAMTTLERSFGLKYPLPKLDMVAIPGHTGSVLPHLPLSFGCFGALLAAENNILQYGMEHWGCVSYDEGGLILNKNPSVNDKLRVAQLVTHELSHQWFGNIVTMKWWESVWLNESFAEWSTLYALTQMLPEYDSWAGFIASDPTSMSQHSFQEALDLDSNKGSHAIQDPNIPPSAAFDSIAYLKGCSLIRMMAEDLGTDVFLKGISYYLEKHKYGNATTEDLWDALSEVSGQDVANTMSTWTRTVGYPLLTVNELRPTSEIVVTQSRFLQDGDDGVEAEAYPVRIHLSGPDGIKTHLMIETKTRIPVNLFRYKLNSDVVGFYRVSYPLSRIHKLGVQFAGKFFSAKDQIGIVSDLGAVVASGASSRSARLPDFLDFLLVIKDHITDLFVWREILSQLQKIRAAFLYEGKVIQILKSVRWELLSNFVKKESLEFKPDDSFHQTLFTTLLFSQLKDHPLTQESAASTWNKLLSGDKDAINPNIKKIVFETVLVGDVTDETWNNLKSIAFEGAYFPSTDPITRREALYALGSSPKPVHIAHILEIITPPSTSMLHFSAGSKISTEVSPVNLDWNTRYRVLRCLCQHASGAQASWDWLRRKWDFIRRSRKGSINGYQIIEEAIGGLATSEHLSQVEKFFEGKVEESYKLELDQVIDVIRSRARLVEADRDDLLEWGRQGGFL